MKHFHVDLISFLFSASLTITACASQAPPSVAPSEAPTGTEGSVTPTLEPAPAFTRQYTTRIRAGETWDLAVADLNEDGALDLVAGSASRLGLTILLGRGDGTFDAGPDIEVAPSNFVRAADLNGDAHVDLVASGDELEVLIGKGDGTFELPVYYAAGSDTDPSLNILRPDAADLNADTIPDLVTANWHASRLAVLLGTGDGSFGPAALFPCLYCHKVALADLDADGDIDVVAASHKPPVSEGRLYVFLNDGVGTLNEAVEVDPHGNAATIALGHLDGDGALDVITANDASSSVSVLLGRGDGTLQEPRTYRAGNTHTLAVVDLDGDGVLDVLSGSTNHTRVWFYRGTGDGSLIETQGIDVAPDVALSLVAADFNGDGKLDLALSYPGQVVSVLLAR